jgi:hypothetical protein
MKGTRVAKVFGYTPPGVTETRDYYSEVDQGKTQGGAKDPSWRDKVARGDNASNNYDVMIRYLTPGGISVSASPASPGDSVSFTGYITGMEPYTTFDSALANKLVGQATIRALARSRSGFSAGTMLGELGEAINMVRHPALAMQRLVKDYSQRAQAHRFEYIRRNMTPEQQVTWLRKHSKVLPDLYLELQYGWKPLAQDVESAIDAASRAANNPKKVRFNGTASQTITLPNVNVASYNNFPSSAYRLKVDRVVVAEYSAKVAGSASIKLGFGMPAFQAGSTIPDIVPTLWNLCPWSFLIDYFSNVGQVLEAHATASLLKVNYGYTNQRAVINTVNDVYFVGGPSKATYGSKCVHFNRRKMSVGFPIPSFSFDERPSKGQSMNIAALAASLYADKIFRTDHPFPVSTTPGE